MGLEQIRCTIVIWDESQHVSLKRLENVKNEFDEFYCNVFPEGRSVKNVLLASESEYFKKKPITKFLHEGKHNEGAEQKKSFWSISDSSEIC